MSESNFPLTCSALRILRDRGVAIEEAPYLEKVLEYQGLCSTWNLSAKLMSQTDLSSRFDEHLADSISLIPYISDAPERLRTLVDIGSGVGFPAIPLCLALPALSAILIERSETKSVYLRHALSRLGLIKAAAKTANFPKLSLPERPRVITARAVERPSDIDSSILKGLRKGDVYLAQRKISIASGIYEAIVDEVDDEFSTAGIRRGKLYSVRC